MLDNLNYINSSATTFAEFKYIFGLMEPNALFLSRQAKSTFVINEKFK